MHLIGVSTPDLQATLRDAWVMAAGEEVGRAHGLWVPCSSQQLGEFTSTQFKVCETHLCLVGEKTIVTLVTHQGNSEVLTESENKSR